LRASARTPVFAVNSDHKEIGRLQAKQVAALLPRGGNILYIQGPSETTAARDRAIGFQSALLPNVQTVILKGQWTEESAARCVTSWLKLDGLQQIARGRRRRAETTQWPSVRESFSQDSPI